MASGPQTQPAPAQSLQNYTFPHDRLRLRQTNADKTPLVLIACGSFSPITYLHLRMFELGADFAKFNTDFEVMGGYFSPVSDAYKKAGLASAEHRYVQLYIYSTFVTANIPCRLRMCELGAAESPWLMVDPWEARQAEYVPTAQVLDHFEHEINEVLGGAEKPDGTRVKCRILLLAGADLIQTMCKHDLPQYSDRLHVRATSSQTQLRIFLGLTRFKFYKK